jgi:hypothetical protein
MQNPGVSKIGGQNPPRVQHGPVSDDQGVLVVDRVNVDDLKSAVGTNHTSHAWRASVSGRNVATQRMWIVLVTSTVESE